jgi:hypothetical protein
VTDVSHGFQFTPAGLLRLDEPVPQWCLTGEMAPCGAGIVKAIESRGDVASKPAPAPVVASAPARNPNVPLTGKEIVSLTKARVKEIDRQLKAMPALIVEREALRALLVAAESGARAARKKTSVSQEH